MSGADVKLVPERADRNLITGAQCVAVGVRTHKRASGSP